MNKERIIQLQRSFESSELMKLFRAQAHLVCEGNFEIRVPKQSFMLRPAGMFNGSTMAALIDVSAGYAAASVGITERYLTTVELKINYLSPAIGDTLIAKAQVIKSGKRLTVVRADVFTTQRQKEELVATSLVTLMHLENRNNVTQID